MLDGVSKHLFNEVFASKGLPLRILEMETSSCEGGESGHVLIQISREDNMVVLETPVFVPSGRVDRRSLRRVIDQQQMLLAERISPTVAASLRNNGVPFADERGNCFLDFGPVLIDIRGAGSTQRKAGKETRNGRALNLFAPKRAQVAAMILSYPQILSLSVRDIANASGVSFGTAVNTINLLVETGYLSRRGSKLVVARDRISTFAESWADAFASGLGKNLESFRGDGDIDALQQSDAVFWVSGEAAVPDRISGGGLGDLYVDDSSSVRSLVRLGRMRASESGAITIKKSFWDLEEVGLDAARVATRSSTLSGRLRAPIAIVYADLWSSGDPRLAGIAYEIKREIIEQVENVHDVR
ncbi:hypothetical protein ACUXOC_001037 [Corynebacterium mucifaciens]